MRIAAHNPPMQNFGKLRGDLVDGLYRIAYRYGYRAMRLWWRVSPPRHIGVGVLILHQGRVLAVRHSYRQGLGIPGGRIDAGEAPEQAAIREIREELGLDLSDARFDYLQFARSTHYFRTVLDAEPIIRIDNREIIEAVFLTPDQARQTSRYFRLLLDTPPDMAEDR
jgi:8-oxo-dGTP pyrophosphatase MutT (NUDIX family)